MAIFDNIKVLKPTGNAQYQGFQILMSGKGCRNYENWNRYELRFRQEMAVSVVQELLRYWEIETVRFP